MRIVDDGVADATAVLSTAYPHRNVESIDFSTVHRQRDAAVAGYVATQIGVDSSQNGARELIATTSFSGVCE